MLTRTRVPEIMDDPNLDHSEHQCALRGLARLNSCSGAQWALWRPIRQLANAFGRKDLRVLDIATGSADNPIALWELARRAGYNLQIDGCDISDVAVETAKKRAARAGAPSQFFRLDVVNDPIPEGYDVLMCSLFTHHLDHAEAVALLEKMRVATRHMVLVNDLVRSMPSLVMVALATQMLSRSRVVHFDGPASVRASFTPEELKGVAAEAGMPNAVVHHSFPCRMLLAWNKHS
jgi:2-polyprenyl-3-methyl-5-hydroxy-6-metoxy-1,4-benzoquinol methylase